MQISIGKKRFEVLKCKSFISKLIGLMFRTKGEGAILIFNKERRVSLHTFFIFHSLDIICLDSSLKIIKIIKDVKPFTLVIFCPKCKYIIELKANSSVVLDNKVELIH